MAAKNTKANMINEQYRQYYEMLRHHTSLSWNIPSFAIACAILFFGLDSNNLQSWDSNPILPAACFFIIFFFLVVMLIHHIRNGYYAEKFDNALAKIERRWGYPMNVHHPLRKHKDSFLNRVSSSLCLTIFMGLSALTTLAISIYFIFQI